jgi:hypothetical protein
MMVEPTSHREMPPAEAIDGASPDDEESTPASLLDLTGRARRQPRGGARGRGCGAASARRAGLR